MAAAPTILQFRLMLSAVDRGLDLSTKLVVARREDEPMAHVILRVLAYCLFCTDVSQGGLRLAPGPADRDGPDLWAHDLGGRPSEWIICGVPDIEDLRHVLQHQRQAKIRIVVGSPEERERFLAAVRSFRRTLPGLAAVELREVDARLIETLARVGAERQRWLVTFVDGHLYVDADGAAVDGEVSVVPLPIDELARA